MKWTIREKLPSLVLHCLQQPSKHPTRFESDLQERQRIFGRPSIERSIKNGRGIICLNGIVLDKPYPSRKPRIFGSVWGHHLSTFGERIDCGGDRCRERLVANTQDERKSS